MFIKKLLSYLIPYTCLLCGSASDREQDLCQACYQNLPVASSTCQQCAIALPLHSASLRCGSCLKKPPPYEKTYALFTYESPIDTLLLELKFSQSLLNAQILGELMAEKMALCYQNTKAPDLILPVPLHRARLKERGYNQAVEIARPIAKRLKLPLDLYTCQRIKHTAAQAQLPAEQRKQNIKDAFRCAKSLEGYYIAVVDDVITTGHTMREFCRLLKQQGARRIDVWCCARAMIQR